LAVVAVALFVWLRSSDVFAVEEIRAPVTHHVTQDQMAEAVASARGVSLLKVSTGAIERTLEALPYVRSIHVYRKFPHALEIRLEEYEPVARVRTAEGKTWLVADDGRFLDKAASQSGASSLPLIVSAAQVVAQTGKTAPQAVVAALPVAALLQTPDVASRLPGVEQIAVSAGGEVVVRLDGGAELRLGLPTDLNQKISVAAKMVQEYLRDGKTLEYVDASATGRVAVKAE
jgi:cell division septal protein FtsQ